MSQSPADERQRSVLMGELRAPELRRLAERHATVVVPVAAIEQHGPHLPVVTDTLLTNEVCRRAAEQACQTTPVIVTECVWSGLSEHHMAFGGTITLRFGLFQALIDAVIGSMYRHGFRRFVLVNGHGGNIQALRTITDELAFAHTDTEISSLTYWTLAAEELGALLETQKGIRHACEAETSMVMALRPDLVDVSAFEEAACPDPRDSSAGGESELYRWQDFQSKTPSGVLGDPRAASAEKGERLLTIAAKALAGVIEA